MAGIRGTGFLLAGLLVALAGSARAEEKGVIKLFNGKDLKNFYTYLGAPEGEKEPLGKNNDPRKVFTVVDGAIRVSGEVWGCFTTEKEYGDYHLIVEFKWGDKTVGRRAKAARDSGILIHCQGADGALGGNWMASIECQMIEGGTGDILVLSTKDHKYSLTAEVEQRPTGKDGKPQPYYKPGGTPQTFTSGRINWYGRDPQWTDTKGFRGKEDVEKPVGEWNTYEVIADGDTITAILNGKVVNKGTKCSHTRGKVLFQSEGAEVFFRKIDLKPLKK